MTLNYIGSKLSLLDFIHFIVDKEINEKISVVGDLFAGTGIVGQSFKRKGYKIVANDIQYYSFVLNKKYLTINDFVKFDGLVEEIPNLLNYEKKGRILKVLNYLNNLKDEKRGFIFNNYSLDGTKGKKFERMYFSDKNALKIDTIRLKIEEWFISKKINEKEYFYLLGTLLEASDKVANTASKYAGFLKELKKSAQKELQLKYTEIIFGDKENVVFNDDVLNILNKEKIDLLYLDPPYNEQQYCSNYHLLETIAKYDDPHISGKLGVRNYKEQKSKFCSKAKVKEEFKKIVKTTNARYILLSYNNEGLMTIRDIQEILSLRGEPKTFYVKYKRFESNKRENRKYRVDFTYEYLNFVRCEENRDDIKDKEFPIIEIDSTVLNNQAKLTEYDDAPPS